MNAERIERNAGHVAGGEPLRIGGKHRQLADDDPVAAAAQTLKRPHAPASMTTRAGDWRRNQDADLAALQPFVRCERHLDGQALQSFGFRAVEGGKVAPEPREQLLE